MSGVARPQDAFTAFLPLYGEDTFTRALKGGSEAALVSPEPDPRLAPDWRVLGTLVAQDRPVGGILGSQTAFYGWLLERAASPGDFAAVIRGTGDLKEWFLDFEANELVAHSVAGRVEYGFWSIFQSMRYRPGGDAAREVPAAQGIAQAVGAGRLLVTGHSLGSALATYLAFDAADPKLLGSRVELVVFASPRPGDATFGTAFNFQVPAYRSYRWQHDVVPRVPFGFGYTPLSGSIELQIPPAVKVCTSPRCAHHALTYCRLINPAAVSSFQRTPEDDPFLSCLGLQQ